MSKPIRLAFIGSGNWSRRYHFPALAHIQNDPNLPYKLRLHGICSQDHAEAQQVATMYEFDQVYESLHKLVADGEIDAVAIAVPPDALVDIVEQVLPLNVPILSEKPPGISLDQASHLAEIVTVPNIVAFNRRFVPLNNQFKAVVDEMVNPYFIEGHFFRHDRHDPDFVLATGIHWINYLEYLFGEIKTVRNTRYPHPGNDTLVRIAAIDFASGLHGLIKFFPCTGSQGERVEVHSEHQSAYLYGPLWSDPGKIILESATRNPELHRQRPQHLRIAGTVDEPEIVAFGIAGEYAEFLNIVADGGMSRSNFQNAVNAMRVAEAIENGVDLR